MNKGAAESNSQQTTPCQCGKPTLIRMEDREGNFIGNICATCRGVIRTRVLVSPRVLQDWGLSAEGKERVDGYWYVVDDGD
jgi:hypothetical protein